MTDQRVVQLWDEEKLAGHFFAEEEGFQVGPIAYDIYYLYGQQAQWDDKPSPLVSSGYTVMGKRGQLQEDVKGLLGP
jgi:hypothetical protein